ncbi:unnamed protein product [marine sediment metagenome]|uniref:Uncharacterized protein n=1 Tax=marine sediment metagenome TaxID=412755 RepID=X1ERR3_9ZZZZ
MGAIVRSTENVIEKVLVRIFDLLPRSSIIIGEIKRIPATDRKES